jgi:hypothetical protein
MTRNKQKELLCQFVSMFFVFLQKNIAQKPVDGRETVKEAFSCTPPEIVSAAKKKQNTHFQSTDYFSKTVIIVQLETRNFGHHCHYTVKKYKIGIINLNFTICDDFD